MSLEDAEDLLQQARLQARRLSDELSDDASDLRGNSSKCLDESSRRQGGHLLGDALKAAEKLREQLEQETTSPENPEG